MERIDEKVVISNRCISVFYRVFRNKGLPINFNTKTNNIKKLMVINIFRFNKLK